MRRSCKTSTTRQGAHDTILGSWAFVGLLRGAGTVARYPFLGGFARRDARRNDASPNKISFDKHWPFTDRTQLLAYVTGLINQELLLKNEYLAAENCFGFFDFTSTSRLSGA